MTDINNASEEELLKRLRPEDVKRLYMLQDHERDILKHFMKMVGDNYAGEGEF